MPETSFRQMRLLVSANDPGAAFHLREILKYVQETDQIEVILLAGGEARSIFECAGFASYPMTSARVGHGDAAGELRNIEEAVMHISKFAPDAILVGLSGPDRGMDEALIACAGGTPTYAVQDYWGDVNSGFGSLPGTYFVLDEFAANITRLCAPASRVVVAGSARHAAMTGLDPIALRKKFREGIGATVSERVIIYFGQPLWGLPGYAATLLRVAEALMRVISGARLRYRPHPKERCEDVARALGCMRAHGVAAQVDETDSVELPLCGSDLMLTCFSTCGLDLAYLNRISAEPLGTMLFTMFDEDIRECYRATTRLDEIPLATQGLGVAIKVMGELEDAIKAGLMENERHNKWRTAQALADPSGAAERIVKKIVDDYPHFNC